VKKESVEWISTGELGVLKLDIPVLKFGDAGAELVITNSVHGDEPIGIAGMSRLAEYLRKQKLNGIVKLVLAANPAAQLIGSRVSPQDLKDLNRVGRGNATGYYTDKLGEKLFNYLRKSDFVVNIHEFEMHTPVTTFFIGEGTKDVQRKILEGIEAFSPEIVWVVKKTNKKDNQYKNTLDAALAIAGTPSFIIETVQMPFISDNEIEKVVNGLISLIEYLGIIPKKNKGNSDKLSNYFYRYEFTSEIAGYWEPQKYNLLSLIKEGDLVGIVKTFPHLKPKKIYAPVSGKLLQFRHRELVKTGSSLFSIGVEVDAIL